MTGWIGVDLDGTLAVYDGWKGPEHIGTPVWPMVQRVRKWLDEGKDVRVFTARVAGDPATADLNKLRIRAWLVNQAGLPPLPITNIKDYAMIELWDDRSVCVERNTGRILGRNEEEAA